MCVYDSANSSIEIQVSPVHNTTVQSTLDTSLFQVYILIFLGMIVFLYFVVKPVQFSPNHVRGTLSLFLR